MIKIDFAEPITEEWRDWVTTCEEETDVLISERRAGVPSPITNLYKDPRAKRVYVTEGPPFYGKCAYCETRIGGSQPGDIEHFRPKNKVTDEAGNVVLIQGEDGAQFPHPGYFWLAYNWRNLLYACWDCNRPSSFRTGQRVGKGVKFPVVGVHAYEPGEEETEQPLLLNPLTDDPAEHLSIDGDTGILIAESERGDACIRVFGLNIREALIKDRARAIRETRNSVLALAATCAVPSPDEQRNLVEELAEVKSGAASFSIARRWSLQRAGADHAPLFDALINGT